MKNHTMKTFFIAVLVLFLAGCGQRGALPAGTHTPWFHGGPSGVLTGIALAATALAGVGLIACAFLAWFYPDKLKIAKLAIACITIIVGAQVTYWLGEHVVLATCLAILALAAGAGVWVWVHRRTLVCEIEKNTGIDINNDAKVG